MSPAELHPDAAIDAMNDAAMSAALDAPARAAEIHAAALDAPKRAAPKRVSALDAPALHAPARDAAALDAPKRDAPKRDALTRDAALDAPALHAPARDAAALDAPKRDAPTRDAAINGATIDAAAMNDAARDAPAIDSGNDAERARVLDLLKRHGWNATSFQVLEPGYRYWFDAAERGCVAYCDTGGAWVVAGAPIAAPEHLAPLASAFAEAAREAGKRACFFGTEQRFVDRAGFRALVLGEQPVWDPRVWVDTVRSTRSLKEQLRRARAKGVAVRRVSADEVRGPLRPALEGLVDRWLRARRMAPMGFLVQLDLFSFVPERRFFVAEIDGRVCAALSCVPIYTRGGWLFEDLVRAPDAPNGTVDLLVDHGMRDLAESGASYATLGLAPLAGGVSGWLRAARSWGRPLYDFEGVRAFKERLKPRGWVPIYLSYPPGQHGGLAVLDSLRAFAGRGLVGFALDTLRRERARGLRLLVHGTWRSMWSRVRRRRGA